MLEESKKIDPHQEYKRLINNNFPKLKGIRSNIIENLLLIKVKQKKTKMVHALIM